MAIAHPSQSSTSQFLKRLRRSLPWYPFIIVNIVVFVVFNLVPWISMFRFSVLKTNLLSTREFIGMGHFVYMLTDAKLHKALLNTGWFTIMYIPLLVALSLGAAVLVNRPLRGMMAFRSLYFLPNVTSVAVLALVFRRFFSPRPDGPINFLIGLVGMPPQKWLIDVNQSMPSLVGISLWEAFGYFMVIWLAGLQGIPNELYDAAKVDGANGWRLHRYVTIPLLRPTAAFIIVIATIGALQVFGSIYILTGGGPVNSTTTVVYQIYNEAFNFNRFGYASALSILFFIMILIVTLIYSKYLRFGEDVY